MELLKLFILVPRTSQSVEYYLSYGQKRTKIHKKYDFYGLMGIIFRIFLEIWSWSILKDNFIWNEKLKTCIPQKGIFGNS